MKLLAEWGKRAVTNTVGLVNEIVSRRGLMCCSTDTVQLNAAIAAMHPRLKRQMHEHSHHIMLRCMRGTAKEDYQIRRMADRRVWRVNGGRGSVVTGARGTAGSQSQNSPMPVQASIGNLLFAWRNCRKAHSSP